MCESLAPKDCKTAPVNLPVTETKKNELESSLHSTTSSLLLPIVTRGWRHTSNTTTCRNISISTSCFTPETINGARSIRWWLPFSSYSSLTSSSIDRLYFRPNIKTVQPPPQPSPFPLPKAQNSIALLKFPLLQLMNFLRLLFVGQRSIENV